MPPPRPFQRDDRNAVRRTRVNHMIRITPIRLIGPNEEMIGVLETQEALRMADQAGMDLVEISPDARPPVCRIMDYGKFKYEQSKKEQATRAASKTTDMKEVRLGRSVKIDPHDVQIRVDQSRRFLMAGHKVMLTQKFRGREIAHKQIGLDRLKEIVNSLADVSKLEQTPRFFGKQASIILAPDKVRIEAIKRKLAKEKAAAEGKDEKAAHAALEAEIKAQAEAAEQVPVPDDGPDEDEAGED